MKWFRLYDDLLDDPKAQQLNPVLFKNWINLLCLASKSEPRGTLPAINDVAFRLRVTPQKARTILKELAGVGLVDAEGDTFHMHNWNERQPNSDNVADRVRKHRESVASNNSVTLQKRFSNALDKEEDKEKEEDTPNPTGDERFERFWKAYPRKVAKDDARKRWKAIKPSESLLAAMLSALEWQRILPDWLKEGGQFIPYPATWLNKGQWQDEPPATLRAQPTQDDRVAAAIAERDRLLAGKWQGQREALMYMPKSDGPENLARRLAELDRIINGQVAA